MKSPKSQNKHTRPLCSDVHRGRHSASEASRQLRKGFKIATWALAMAIISGCIEPTTQPDGPAATSSYSMENCRMMGSVMHIVTDGVFGVSIPGWSFKDLNGPPAIQFHECEEISFEGQVEESVIFGYFYGRHQSSPDLCDTAENFPLILQWAVSNNVRFVDYFKSIGMNISLASIDFQLQPDASQSNVIHWNTANASAALQSQIKVQPSGHYEVKRELFWMHKTQLQVMRFELDGTNYASFEDYTEGEIHGQPTGTPTGTQWLGTTSYFIDLETNVELFAYNSTQCNRRDS